MSNIKEESLRKSKGKYFKDEESDEIINISIHKLKYEQMLLLYDKFLRNREYQKRYQREKTAKMNEIKNSIRREVQSQSQSQSSC